MLAFISYSHRDTALLERLHAHLAVLRRDGLISEWFDRDILAGDVIDEDISLELEKADLFLLLISPDFLASDYCIERELERALERHALGQARVIPIILEPCDWTSMPSLRRLKALPKDGVPVANWTNANNAFVDIVQEIRRVCLTKPNTTPPKVEQSISIPPVYRISRDFSDFDRGEFRDSSFERLRAYFQRSIVEINSVDGLKGRYTDLGPIAFGAAIGNELRNQSTAHITIHRGDANSSLGDIYWSFKENSQPNSANGWLNVSSDEYEQFFEGIGSFGDPELKRLDTEKVASYLWEKLLGNAGVTHA